MEFRILGPLEAGDARRPVALGGPRPRALLAVLLLARGEVVSVDRLIDELWGERPPATARKTVQVYVSQLRKALGDEVLLSRGQGYALDVAPDALDLVRFERLAAEGRERLAAGDARGAAAALRQALALWRGPALAGAADADVLAAEVAELEELRLAALEDRVEAGLALGGHAELAGELERLVRAHPLRERLRAQLMLALYRAGRQADALALYRETRQTLVEELGLEPGRRLQDLESAILRQDRALEAPVAAEDPPAAEDDARRPSRRRQVAAAGAVASAAGLATAIALLSGGGAGAATVAPNSLAAIDPGSNRVVAEVRVGDTPTAVTVGAGGVWVLNADEQTIAQVDPRGRGVVRRIATGGTPTDLAAGSGSVWVVNRPDTLVRVSPGPAPIQQRLRIRLRERPVRFSIPPAAWVAAAGDAVWMSAQGTLARVDARGATITSTRATTFGQGPVALGAGSVWVGGLGRVNARSGALEAILSLPFEPSAVAVGAGAVWLTDLGSDTLWRIDPRVNATERTITVGEHPSGVAVGAGAVWVASQDGTVSRIDPATDRVVHTIRVGGTPHGIAVGAGRVWVTVD